MPKCVAKPFGDTTSSGTRRDRSRFGARTCVIASVIGFGSLCGSRSHTAFAGLAIGSFSGLSGNPGPQCSQSRWQQSIMGQSYQCQSYQGNASRYTKPKNAKGSA